MSKIAGAWIGWAIVMISEITTGDHSKRTDGRERPRLGAAQGVLAVTVAHDLPLESARQLEIARERLARIERAVACVALAIRPASIVAGISAAFAVIQLPRITWTAAERSRVVIAAIA